VEFPSVEHVLEAVDAGLRTYPKLDHLTLSGNGEPTLHPDFLEIARGIRALRDRLQPGLHIAVFSNATTVTQPEIRKALTFFNDPILKLDAGDEATWRAINRPPLGITLAEIVDSLPLVPNLVLQSLFLDGRTQNVRGEPYQAWLRAVKKVQPMLVQVYSVDRPTPECGVVEVPAEGLERIAREITASTGILAHAY
jgi:wyosine [tRNA(Phe)-imidazoG37] synthetase (radical SAM superfamily)